MGLGGEVRAIVTQRGQQMRGGREGIGNGDAGLVELAAQPLMLGLFGALLAEPFGFVLERAGPGRGGEPGDRLRVVIKLGKDRELVEGQLMIQRVDGRAGVR